MIDRWLKRLALLLLVVALMMHCILGYGLLRTFGPVLILY